MKQWTAVLGSLVTVGSLALVACSDDGNGGSPPSDGGTAGKGGGGSGGKGGAGGGGKGGQDNGGAAGATDGGGVGGVGGGGSDCPADLISAEGMSCDKEGLTCSEGDAPCGFATVLTCEEGEWILMEGAPGCYPGGAGGGAGMGGTGGADDGGSGGVGGAAGSDSAGAGGG